MRCARATGAQKTDYLTSTKTRHCRTFSQNTGPASCKAASAASDTRALDVPFAEPCCKTTPRVRCSDMLQRFNRPCRTAENFSFAVLQELLQPPAELQRRVGLQLFARRRLRGVAQFFQCLGGLLPRGETLVVEVGEKLGNLVRRRPVDSQTFFEQREAFPRRASQLPNGFVGLGGVIGQVGPKFVQLFGGPMGRFQLAVLDAAGQVPQEDGGIAAARRQAAAVRSESQGE